RLESVLRKQTALRDQEKPPPVRRENRFRSWRPLFRNRRVDEPGDLDRVADRERPSGGRRSRGNLGAHNRRHGEQENLLSHGSPAVTISLSEQTETSLCEARSGLRCQGQVERMRERHLESGRSPPFGHQAGTALGFRNRITASR